MHRLLHTLAVVGSALCLILPLSACGNKGALIFPEPAAPDVQITQEKDKANKE